MGVLRQNLAEREEEKSQLDRKVTELSATVSSTLASYAFLEQALATETTKYDCLHPCGSSAVIDWNMPLKISFFQVAGVVERHPAGERKRQRVSDTWTFHHWKEQTKQTHILTLPLAWFFVLMQIGVFSGSFRKASVWVKLVSGSKWGAARSAGDTHPVPERRDPAAPGSLHAAQHRQRDERGELTLHNTGAP